MQEQKAASETSGETPSRAAFIVWVERDASGRLEGVVQRARTGEKHRFHDVDSLARLIAGMAGRGTRAGGDG